MRIIYTLESFEKMLNERFPHNHVKVLEYTATNKSLIYQCLDCGQIYHKARANGLYENKTLCQKCYSSRKSKARNWILDFLKRTKNFELIEPWHGTTSVNLKLRCLQCGLTFEKEPFNLYKKEENTICPYCGDNGAPLPKEIFLQRLTPEEQQNFKLLEYNGVMKSAKFQHACGYVFNQKPCNFLKSRGCPKCNKTMSAGEVRIARYLTNNNIQYEYEKHFPEIARLSYDFYLPELNILIEYQGEQHYRPIETFGGNERFEKQQKYDKLKQEYAKEHNITLICIPYYEQGHLESLLQSFLGSTTSQFDVASSEAKEKTSYDDNIV